MSAIAANVGCGPMASGTTTKTNEGQRLQACGINASRCACSGSIASAALLRAARRRLVTPLANVALALEYEAVCNRAEHILASGLTRAEVDIYVTAVIAMTTAVETHFQWRPHLRDPADEMVLEAAVNGHAPTIITFNRRDFLPAALLFGLEVLLPNEALQRITP